MNGKVYGWVQPDANNVKQGDWTPGNLIDRTKEAADRNSRRRICFLSQNKTEGRVAMSNYDVNLFSSKDKNDDKGFATKFNLRMWIQRFIFSKKTFCCRQDLDMNLWRNVLSPLND